MKISLIIIVLMCLPFGVTAQTQQDTIVWGIADSLETSFGENRLDYFSKLFHDSTFLSGILFHKADNKDLTDFNKGFVQGNVMKEFLRKVLNNIEEGAYYNFVNYYEDGLGNYFLIFRYFSHEGINYHEYMLEVMPNGKMAITDVYVYLTGEFLSETLRSIYASLIKQYLEEEELENSPYNLEMLEKIREVASLINRGEHHKARQIYDKEITDEFKKERIALLCELKLTDINDSAAYMNILDRVVKESRGRSAIFLASVDAFFVSGQYDKALQVVDSLYQFTGDPFLDLYRGNIYFASGELQKSKEKFEQLLENFPYLPEAYDFLLAVYYSLDEWSGILTLLDKSIEFVEMDIPSIDGIIQSDYPKFAQTSQYQTWLEEQKRKGP